MADPLRTPCGRTFERAISLTEQTKMFGEAVICKQRYRGIPFAKLPLDVMIYMQLFDTAKPASVIEIGSHAGGAALWFADMLSTTNANARVLSVDLEPPALKDPRIQFLQGDASRIGDVLTDSILATLPRPWLVSEDSAHTFETTKAVLDFCARHLQPGEYIVVEDGTVGELAPEFVEWVERYADGPNRAVTAFLAENPNFEIDTELCDFFGYNITGNPNGYLRRKA